MSFKLSHFPFIFSHLLLPSFLPPLPRASQLPPLLSLASRLYPWSLHLSSVFSHSAKYCLRPFLSLVLKPSSLLFFPPLTVWFLCLVLRPLLPSPLSLPQHNTVFYLLLDSHHILPPFLCSLYQCHIWVYVYGNTISCLLTWLQSSRNVQLHFDGQLPSLKIPERVHTLTIK